MYTKLLSYTSYLCFISIRFGLRCTWIAIICNCKYFLIQSHFSLEAFTEQNLIAQCFPPRWRHYKRNSKRAFVTKNEKVTKRNSRAPHLWLLAWTLCWTRVNSVFQLQIFLRACLRGGGGPQVGEVTCLRAVFCKDRLRVCKIEKSDFPKLCQKEGLGELFLKI